MVPAVVLIADDEEHFVETIRKRLAKRKLIAEGVNSGNQALERLEKNPFIDVVVLDVQMPGLDGLETLRRIKDLRPLVEVILLTGHGTIPNAVKGMKFGAFDYLLKPCAIEDLMAKIEEGKNRKRMQEEKIIEAKAQSIITRRGY